jgi:hypothetical protein
MSSPSDLIPTEMVGYAKNKAAIVNVDSNALESYKRKKRQNRKVNELEDRVRKLEMVVQSLLSEKNG